MISLKEPEPIDEKKLTILIIINIHKKIGMLTDLFLFSIIFKHV